MCAFEGERSTSNVLPQELSSLFLMAHQVWDSEEARPTGLLLNELLPQPWKRGLKSVYTLGLCL